MVRVISVNARGLRDKVKRRAILNYCRDRADLILIQETHSCMEDENGWKMEWGGSIYFSHGTRMAKGVCVMANPKFHCLIRKVCNDENGRALICDVTIDEYVFSICNIYAPNADDSNFFHYLENKLDLLEHPIMMCGDFNLVLDVKKDRLDSDVNNEKALKILKRIMGKFSLVDVWRIRNEDEQVFSWSRNNSASRIDLCLVSKGLDSLVEDILYVTNVLSDHKAVYCSLMLNENKRGRGFWKMNVSLLEKLEFVRDIDETIDKTIQEVAYLNPIEGWEKLKRQIQVKCQELARKMGSERKLIIS